MKSKFRAMRYNWLILIIVLVALSVLDRSLLYGIVDQVRQEFRLTDADVGLLTGAYFLWPVLAGNLIGGILADRISKVDVIAGAALLWGAATLAGGLAQGFSEFAAARIMLGFAQGMAAPTLLAYISGRMTMAWLPFALGLYSVGGTAGYGIALTVTSWAAKGSADGSWREPFIVFGAITVGIGIFTRLALRDPKSALPTPTAKKGSPGLDARWLVFFLVFVLALGLLAGAKFAFHGWLPTAMKRNFAGDASYDQAALGLAISIGGAAGCLIWTLAASIWTKAGRPEASLWILILATIATTPFLLASPIASNVLVGLLFAGLAAMGTQVSSALSHAALQSLTPSMFRGRVAAANMISVTGLSSLITWLVGLASTHSDVKGGNLPVQLAISSGAATLLSIALLFVTVHLYQRVKLAQKLEI